MLNKDTIIAVASAKKIYSEYRLFVVNKKIVTASLYKLGSDLTTTTNIDERVFHFTNKMIRTWIPAAAFVMDIADTPDGLKVIEINNINSSGFYAADPQKIIIAIEEMVKYKQDEGLNLGWQSILI